MFIKHMSSILMNKCKTVSLQAHKALSWCPAVRPQESRGTGEERKNTTRKDQYLKNQLTKRSREKGGRNRDWSQFYVKSFCQEYLAWQQFWGDHGHRNQELLIICALPGTGTVLLFYLWQDPASANELYLCSAAQVIPPPASCKDASIDCIPPLPDSGTSSGKGTLWTLLKQVRRSQTAAVENTLSAF